MNSKVKNVLGVISDILLVMIIIVAIVITVMTFTSKSSETGVGNVLGYTPFSIQSDSMAPTFKSGDLIVGKEVGNIKDLKVGDIITYSTIITDKSGKTIRGNNTHRIVRIRRYEDGTVASFITMGDAMYTLDGSANVASNKKYKIKYVAYSEGDKIPDVKYEDGTLIVPYVDDVEKVDKNDDIYAYTEEGMFFPTLNVMEDVKAVLPDEVLAKQVNSGLDDKGVANEGFKFNSLGEALNFLQSRTGFMICIIIPLALFFIWQIYKLIAMFMEAKAADIDEDTKRRAVEEYLAEQAKIKEAEGKSAEGESSEKAKGKLEE